MYTLVWHCIPSYNCGLGKKKPDLLPEEEFESCLDVEPQEGKIVLPLPDRDHHPPRYKFDIAR